jgi:hypothetical protein
MSEIEVGYWEISYLLPEINSQFRITGIVISMYCTNFISLITIKAISHENKSTFCPSAIYNLDFMR